MKDTDIRYQETRTLASAMVISLDGEWLLATDSQNIGREQQWYAGAVSEAKPTRVPWIIQEAFPGYHGVAWYWRNFVPPANPHAQGRYLLRFWAVDYLAEVWLNGRNVGGHEGSEGPFVLDVTDSIKPKEPNLLAVRVLNPTNEPIDDIALPYIPRRCKVVPFRPGALYNDGGIVDSVELLVAPAVRIADIYVRPDPNTGTIHLQASVQNALPKNTKGHVEFTVAPATSGETLNAALLNYDLPPGDTLIESKLQVDNPRLWNLNEPYLYRVTARIWTEGSSSFDEHSTRCGFRDFRFENGCFRLNGRRIFLKSSHTATHYPIGLHWPHDADLARRELLDMKVMGFNAIRFFCSVPARYQLDLCDEIGFMIYEESFAGWFLQDSPQMGERFDREIKEVIKRDRNHPCVVMWGLLNENPDGPVFRHATGMLPLVRSLDDTRVVMLNSGRFDGVTDIGSLSNPGSMVWEDIISDQHPYKRVPHTAGIISELRTASGGGNPVFISEYGIGSSLDLSKMTRQYEQLGAEKLEDAQWYRERLDRFMVDWKRWNLADTFANPEDYFTKCLARMGKQRLLGLNAIRSNSNIVAYSMTGTTDCGDAGEGVITLFRDLKPGTVDCVFDGWYPLRWCLFVEPVNVYRKTPVRLEAVLANEDMLLPGDYPVRLQVVGPKAFRTFEKTITVTISPLESMPQPSFALPVFAEDVVIDGPSGRYRFLATFEKGGAAAGGEVEFYVADPGEMPAVETEVVLWGEDKELVKWLADHGIRVRPFSPDRSTSREVILASSSPAAPGGAEAFRNLAHRIAQGSTVIFLSPVVFAKGEQPAAWVPLANKGTLEQLPSWLYHKDEWAKHHPIFDGLPAGGLMDYTFYREIIPDIAWVGQDSPTEVVAGAINTSIDYSAGLFVSVNTLGAGRFILNTLHIHENLGCNPVADRLLLNMLRYAARNVNKPLTDRPLDFDAQIKAMGYQ